MRLAVFTNQFPSRVNTFFARDLRGLFDAGFEIDLFPLYPRDEDLWRFVPDILPRELLPDDRIHYPLPPGRNRASRPVKTGLFAAEAARIAFAAARFGPEAAAKTAFAVAQAWRWARSAGRRYDHVLSYWGNYAATSAYVFRKLAAPDCPLSIFLHAGTDLYRRRVFLEEKLDDADNVFVVCEFNREFLALRYPGSFPRWDEKIRVHHPGLPLETLAFDPARKATGSVLAVGRLDEEKGFDDLLRAAALLAGRRRPIPIEIVGGGPRGKRLAALASRLGISSRVAFRGWLSPEETQKAMRDAAVLVHPSSRLGDAVPTVIKESLALGTPVVATTIAGIPELLDFGRCGVLVPPRDPAALADALERLLADPARRRRLADAGRAFAERKLDMRINGPALARALASTPRRPSPQAPAPARPVLPAFRTGAPS